MCCCFPAALLCVLAFWVSLTYHHTSSVSLTLCVFALWSVVCPRGDCRRPNTTSVVDDVFRLVGWGDFSQSLAMIHSWRQFKIRVGNAGRSSLLKSTQVVYTTYVQHNIHDNCISSQIASSRSAQYKLSRRSDERRGEKGHRSVVRSGMECAVVYWGLVENNKKNFWLVCWNDTKLLFLF